QHGLALHVGRGDERVDAPVLGALQRLGRALDVAGRRTGERRDHRTADAVGDLADGLELALRRDREAGLEDVDLQPRELLGDLDLLGLGQRDPGSVLPVAQGGIEDPHLIGAASYYAWLTHLSSAPSPRTP